MKNKTKNLKQKAIEWRDLLGRASWKTVDKIKNSQKQKYEKKLKKWERDYNRNVEWNHKRIQELQNKLSQIRTNTLKEVLKIVDEEIKLCILNEGDDLLLKQLKSQIKKLK